MKLTLFLLFLLPTTLVGQRHRVQISLEGVHDTEYLLNKVNSLDLIKIDDDAKELLTIRFDESKLRSLEGISSSVQGKGFVVLHLASPTLGWDSTWTFQAPIKAKSKWEANQLLSKTFVEKELENTVESINSALDNLNARNCTALLTRANSALKRYNYKEAYVLAERSAAGNCYLEAEVLKKKIELAYGEDFCKNQLPKINILAASGIPQKMEKALERLYGFPVNSPCAAEVKEVAKALGELTAKMPENEKANFTTVIIQGLSLYQIFGL